MTTAEKIVAKIDYLPPFPLTVTRVLRMLQDPCVTPGEIADGIRFDQAIALNVL